MFIEETLFDIEKDSNVVIAQVFESVPDQDLTLYSVGIILNKILSELKIMKKNEIYQVRTQMMYNYNKNKMIVKGASVQRVTKAQCMDFVTRFVERNK